ncbi:PDDEXK_1 domain-containing protein [Candidatus Nitrotoga sp. HW29]|uniref:PD-(D/E)XK nuclease family protein n=1 Tax=Candidatus Nitrotoga sp. HW29 TaxID=2886963 RepID=UPI001EF35924|nr:PD-(D/E)XK nuclease family protein [Candidatus Nitrotoga sp. HW29]CAH1903669.1 PDDEXK_1 domain-containing protein [Candidatus Nitrotoga sp. HW29]
MNPIPQSNTSTAAVFFDSVARVILTRHSHEIPDLRRARVLLPNYHVSQPLAQSLARVANLPAILLPQMVTLSDWVQSVPLALSVIPDTCRITTLYQALRARRWFADADLWSIARELLVLLDELTQNHVTLPQSAEDFLSQLEQAYQSKRGIAMQFEARVVHELWYAMNNSGELDTARAYQQNLTQLAQQAELPLYVLLTSNLAAPEARFLKAYHQRAPVMIIDLRELASQQPECAAMRIIASSRSRFSDPIPTENEREVHDNLRTQESVEEMDALSLREQANHLQKHFPRAALGHRLHFFGAHGLEQEARAAEGQIRRWLLAGKKNIAIVAQDRLVARRMRALLERAGVLVCDETGWKLSTLSVSTALMRWLDALQSDFYYQDLLDLLKSPFIFADQAVSERKQTVYQFEQLVRKHGVVAHLDTFFDLTQGNVGMRMALIRLRQAAEVLHKKNDTLSGWLSALYASLEMLGIVQGLKLDDAGIQLLQALQNWQRELHGDTTRVSLTEWRHWLAQQLDEHTFRDLSIDSPVLLTHLAAMRWRSFDAVLMLGCDAAHLPGTDNSGRWFNDAVRTTLGLPTREVYLAQQRDDLLALLAMNDTVLVTWQASKSGEANLLSPCFEMLRALHELAYGDDLTIKPGEWDKLLESTQVRSAEFPLPPAAAMPAPVARQGLIPKRISASGYNSLVACPYQFYARHILHLNEMDEVREDVEKRDYGEWVHDILWRFHEQYQVLGNHLRADLDSALQHISIEIFTPAVQRDYLARAWLLRWQQAIPEYLETQLKNEAEGWRYQSGEVPFELPLSADLLMHGRIDRVDVQAKEASAVRVLDYKMMDAVRLRNKLKEAGEDVQLACYAYVYEAEEAVFISIEKDKVIAVAPPQDVADLAQANIARLLEVFAQMRSGAALPAHGAEEACQYCEMRGLCRKSEWNER